MTALENAKKIDEFGGCTMMSAPTPSTRFPHSETTPEVSPAIISTKTTWMAMAITLSELRSGRVEMLPQNICTKENRPSNVSFMLGSRDERITVIEKRQRSADPYCTISSESRAKYFALIKFCTHVLISLCKTHHAFPLTARPSILFPSLHNFRASSKNITCLSLWLCKLQRGLKLILELFRDGTLLGLIPLGRSIEMNLDRLLRIRDVVPPPEGFPSFRDNLYLHSSKWRIRNMRDSLTVGLHIQLELFIFRNFVFFNILQIDAGIFDRTIFIATGDFNGYAGARQRPLGLALRDFLRVADAGRHYEHCQQARKACGSCKTKFLHTD